MGYQGPFLARDIKVVQEMPTSHKEDYANLEQSVAREFVQILTCIHNSRRCSDHKVLSPPSEVGGCNSSDLEVRFLVLKARNTVSVTVFL